MGISGQENMDTDKLNRKFDQAMLNIYRRTIDETDYAPKTFFRMLSEHRGYGTARRLIHSPKVSDGYVKLYELSRLDLTVEAVIYENKMWHLLFNENELGICRKRLEDYGYQCS